MPETVRAPMRQEMFAPLYKKGSILEICSVSSEFMNDFMDFGRGHRVSADKSLSISVVALKLVLWCQYKQEERLVSQWHPINEIGFVLQGSGSYSSAPTAENASTMTRQWVAGDSFGLVTHALQSCSHGSIC